MAAEICGFEPRRPHLHDAFVALEVEGLGHIAFRRPVGIVPDKGHDIVARGKMRGALFRLWLRVALAPSHLRRMRRLSPLLEPFSSRRSSWQQSQPLVFPPSGFQPSNLVSLHSFPGPDTRDLLFSADALTRSQASNEGGGQWRKIDGPRFPHGVTSEPLRCALQHRYRNGVRMCKLRICAEQHFS